MQDLPITVKRSIELLGIFLLGTLIVVGSDIIMPLLMAFFISTMLLPVYRFLKRKRLPDTLAIIVPILFLLIFVSIIVWFFSKQVGVLVGDFPHIKHNVNIHLADFSDWIQQLTSLDKAHQIKIINEQFTKLSNSTGNLFASALGSISGVFVFFGLIPIYIYLMLLYKNLFLRFIFMWFDDRSHKKVEESLRETESIIKSYLIGLLIQITYITVLLGGILMLFGIKHAILIGVIFALLNLIPYVGALIGNIIGVLLTLTSSTEISSVITVLAVIAVVQFLDNNILMPRIVGSKVKINALSAILGVIIGGTLAGISGMFLALPIIAVLKIIFDRSEMFKHWGVLLGDDVPDLSPLNFPIFRKKNKSK
jgi:predicted PurR-regulated permease PerM